MRQGRQKCVESPGKNHKVVAFGAWCFASQKLLWHTQPRKTAWGARHLIDRLTRRAQRTGKKIVLVLDQGNPHHAKVVHRDLELAAPWVEVFWLPHYAPELNLIERVWKHLKATRMANVLLESVQAFLDHVERMLKDFAAHPDLNLLRTYQTSIITMRRKLVGLT